MFQNFAWKFCDLARFNQVTSLFVPTLGERVFHELIPAIDVAWDNEKVNEFLELFSNHCERKLSDIGMR
jgi:hypothetical protein